MNAVLLKVLVTLLIIELSLKLVYILSSNMTCLEDIHSYMNF
jgi:hypothetical protein